MIKVIVPFLLDFTTQINIILSMIEEQKVSLEKHVIPDPVSSAGIQFLKGEELIQYTDCWEISTLRFLHLLFGDHGVISQEKFMKFMDSNSQHCQSLIQFFKENPTYQMGQQYYKTEEALLLRAKWCQLLNNCGLLYLKKEGKEGKYEVAATIPNILSFHKGYFPKLSASFDKIEKMTLENLQSGELVKSYQTILNEIYHQLSWDHSITTEIVSNFNQAEDWLFLSFNMKLFIKGEYLLDWEITECYNCSDEIKQRLGGHSEYRYPPPPE